MQTGILSLKTMSPELRKRVLTGVIGGFALLLLLIFGSTLGIFVLSAGLSMAMVYEYSEIVFTMPDRLEKRYLMLCIAWFVALVNLVIQAEAGLMMISFMLLFGYFLFTAQRYSESQYLVHFKEFAFCCLGLFYLVFMPQYLVRIYEGPSGVEWTIVFLLIVWAGDTGAYFAGKKYGRRKLYPAISPKKTLEGAAGGLLSGFVITLLFKLAIFRGMSWAAVVIAPIVVGVFAQIGDFCESLFKRAFDKKDSGTLLPGHGGIMDRFDGVVFSLPVMYACIRVLG